MTPEFITGIFIQAIKTAILLSAPMLLSGLAVGILVSMFQAATQINEMTLTFIPKLIIVVVVLMAAGPWMLRVIMNFTITLFENIPELIG
jgi:flagellar biosynthetic protein FliQ